MSRALAISLCILAAVANSGLAAETHAPSPAQIEFFEKKIRPILANNCFKCHGPEKQKGGLRLDSRGHLLKGGDSGPVVDPEKPEQSELVKAVRYEADGYQMPPTGKLPDEQIAALTEWVKMGAPWPDDTANSAGATKAATANLAERAKHWSFQPVRKELPPRVSQADWPRSPVDNFVLAKLESSQLAPAQPADKQTLLRRVTFDLIGLPPTPEEIDEFLSDESPEAYERVVERLLASPHYGERWGRHWLDLVRFAETSGHEFDYDILHAWPYRDYVVRAYNDDVPYNLFVTEQIAGDLIPSPRRHPERGTNESVIGTGFFWFGQGKHSPVDIRAEECDTVDNQIDVLGKTFLGLTIACARCHDHKFDPLTSKDYYALAGCLQSSRREYAPLEDPATLRPTAARLAKLKAEQQPSVAQAIAAFAESVSIDASTNLRDSLQISRRENSLFWRVAELAARGDSRESFLKRREELQRELQAQSKAAREFVERGIVFENFDGRHSDRGHFDKWFISGEAFGAEPTRTIDWIVGETSAQPVQQFVSPGVAHSGLISGRLRGTLRSATFTIEKPFIHYRVARYGGRAIPGLAAKNGQIHLIVDGFHIIKDPLYGGLSINIPQNEPLQWRRQDVGRFLGSRAYIELEDDDDGWLAIDKIVFSDDPTAVDEPGSLALGLLDEGTSVSADSLSKRWRAMFVETASAWGEGRLAELTSPAERVELLNILLSQGSLEIPSAVSGQERPPNTSNQFMEFIKDYRQLASNLHPPQLALAMTDGTPENEHVLIRGNHKKPGEEVPRRFLEVFDSGKEPSPEVRGSGRLELARRITDSANPLTARVLVNRLWHHHFGRGIVSTPDDFGRQGQPPSHPELLDFLASELVRHDGSIKSMHRLMVLSSTYRMSSRADDPRPEQIDPQNVLLHRMPLRRLEGEILRDAMLALSGRLDSRMEGPSVPPFLTEFMEGRGRPSQSGPLDGDGRRSVYITVRRNFLTPLFLAFDYPTPFSTAGRRSVSNVPAQALSMMNNPLVVQQARMWAERVNHGSVATPEERLRRLFHEAFGRAPDPTELEAALKFLEANRSPAGRTDDPQAWADLCHALFNVKEFLIVK